MSTYAPNFPYTGNEAIITSDRVTLLADKDAVFVFGNQAVSLSSQNTVNLDASNKVIISSPVINLGDKNADTLGESAVLGDTLVSLLTQVISTIQDFLDAAANVEYSDLSTLSDMAISADNASMILDDLSNSIQNSITSDVVYITKNQS